MLGRALAGSGWPDPRIYLKLGWRHCLQRGGQGGGASRDLGELRGSSTPGPKEGLLTRPSRWEGGSLGERR